MTTPNEDTVKNILSLKDRDIVLRNAFYSAWDKFKEKYPDRAWWRRKSTRAGIVWEYAIDAAIEGYENDDGVQVIPHHDTFSFTFDDTVLVRLKKVDVELRSSNVQTKLAALFHAPEADLFGYTGLQRVEAGYMLNQFETDIDWVGIIARQDKRNLWHFELEESNIIAPTLPLIPEEIRKPAELAKLKKPKKKDKGASESE